MMQTIVFLSPLAHFDYSFLAGVMSLLLVYSAVKLVPQRIGRFSLAAWRKMFVWIAK
jgi:hypothetical protein